jgi:uncharacterized protein (TIGR03435 family)
MKIIATCVAAIVLFFTASLAAQDIAGSWQGTLQAKTDTRLILKISKADSGSLKGVLVWVDQNGQSYRISPVTLQDSTFKFTAFNVVHYVGKLGADGNTIAGTWTDPPNSTAPANSWPLNFSRVTKETAWTIPRRPAAMADDAVFDVSTVRASKPGSAVHNSGIGGRQHEWFGYNRSLISIMELAYTLQARQVVGAPAWVETDKWDVDAKTDAPGEATDRQMKTMIRKLLEDRFKLKYHWDKKEMPAYKLSIAKDGPKLTKSETVGDLHSSGGSGPGHYNFSNYTMQNLCDVLGRNYLAKPAVDQTGLEGRYDFTLNWTPDEYQYGNLGLPVPPPSDSADAPPNLSIALQQQLGLKLEQGKYSVDVLVIDHVEKPTEN